MNIRTWATFGVTAFLLFFFSYALVAQGKKVYTEKKNAPHYLFIQAQSAYISQSSDATDYLLTLSAVSPTLLGLGGKDLRSSTLHPMDKLLDMMDSKELAMEMTYMGGDTITLKVKGPTYHSYKEELTFVLESTSLPLNERFAEPTLLYEIASK